MAKENRQRGEKVESFEVEKALSFAKENWKVQGRQLLKKRKRKKWKQMRKKRDRKK